MSFSEIYAISEFGLDLERTRLKAAAFNIAAQNTVYSKESLNDLTTKGVMRVNTQSTFLDSLNKSQNINYYYDGDIKAVQKPNHTNADETGSIYMPNINIAEQMITLTSAEKAYEANIKAMNTIYAMAQKTMEIGSNR